MNRIKLSPLAALQQPETNLESSPSVAEAGKIPPRTRSPQDLSKLLQGNFSEDLSLFVPLHYEARYAYPLIVWLHQDGRAADQVQQIMLQLSLQNYVAVGAQSSIGSRQTGYFWDQEWDTIDLAHKAVEEGIEQASSSCHINPRRIFLAGSGSGGTMAFRLAFARPDLFAGVISINGPLASGPAPLKDWQQCRDMPIFLAHDRASADFQQNTVCDHLKLFYTAGFDIQLRQYPTPEVLASLCFRDLNRWIMEMISSAVLDPKPE